MRGTSGCHVRERSKLAFSHSNRRVKGDCLDKLTISVPMTTRVIAPDVERTRWHTNLPSSDRRSSGQSTMASAAISKIVLEYAAIVPARVRSRAKKQVPESTGSAIKPVVLSHSCARGGVSEHMHSPVLGNPPVLPSDTKQIGVWLHADWQSTTPCGCAPVEATSAHGVLPQQSEFRKQSVRLTTGTLHLHRRRLMSQPYRWKCPTSVSGHASHTSIAPPYASMIHVSEAEQASTLLSPNTSPGVGFAQHLVGKKALDNISASMSLKPGLVHPPPPPAVFPPALKGSLHSRLDMNWSTSPLKLFQGPTFTLTPNVLKDSMVSTMLSTMPKTATTVIRPRMHNKLETTTS
eukprot:3940379-Rhodomonas_salina.3